MEIDLIILKTERYWNNIGCDSIAKRNSHEFCPRKYFKQGIFFGYALIFSSQQSLPHIDCPSGNT